MPNIQERPLVRAVEGFAANPRLYEGHLPGADRLQFSRYSGVVALDFEPLFTRERQQTVEAIESMAVRTPLSNGEEEVYYDAAFPSYKRDFTRDTMKTGLMAGDNQILNNQIKFSARRLGRVEDPLTGEEPGKPPHEWPAQGEILLPFRDDRFITYNACDTGAMLLQGIAALIEHGDPEAAYRYEQTIQRVVSYVRRHVNRQGLFVEDPVFSGDTAMDGSQRKFASKVTNWKDSELNRLGRREPHYPIVYTIAHFQNAYALQQIGKATNNDRLTRMGRYMTEQGLAYLWRDDHFVSAIDRDGKVDPPSTDSLEALLYISPQQLPPEYASRIERYMKQLETEAGYRAGIPVVSDMDMYHMNVWVHSQAELHAAAQLHGLIDAAKITERVRLFIDRKNGIYPEMVHPETYDLCGNIRQLWAMGADLYFLNPEKSYL